MNRNTQLLRTMQIPKLLVASHNRIRNEWTPITERRNARPPRILQHRIHRLLPLFSLGRPARLDPFLSIKSIIVTASSSVLSSVLFAAAVQAEVLEPATLDLRLVVRVRGYPDAMAKLVAQPDSHGGEVAHIVCKAHGEHDDVESCASA